MTRFVVAVLAGTLSGPVAYGVSPDPKDLVIPPQELSKARELVRKLGSEFYKDREEAHAELAKMGRLARPALLEAVTTDPDPEVRFRSSLLLPRAAAADLQARLETFLADTDGRFEHDLPGLKYYRKLIGTDKPARDLFVEMVKSPYNVELLQTLERSPTDAGRAIADRRNSLYGDMQQRFVPGKPVQPPKQPQLPDIACLLLAEALTPSREIPRNALFAYVTGVTFLQLPASNNALNTPGTPHAEAYKRIVSVWLDSRDDVQDLNQLPYIVGQQLRNLPQSTPLLRRIVTTEGVQGYAKGQALMYLVQNRQKEEIPFLKSLLKDDSVVTSVWFGGQIPNQPPVQHQCLLRDVALALLIQQTGQKMLDYGFSFPPGLNPEQAGRQLGYGHYAFVRDEARTAALVKFGFWQLKQGLKQPTKTEPQPD
jgi:hypothetical protein